MSSAGQGQLRLTSGRKLRSPRGNGTRPTTARVREAVMNILAPQLHGAHWLDLCSGSGVMGCEALQRGAQRVVALEQDRPTAAICRNNLEATAAGQSAMPTVMVVQRDLISWLQRGKPNDDPGFDLVYFDPPYASGLYSRGLDALINGEWLQPNALVLCEHAKHQKPPPSRMAGRDCVSTAAVLCCFSAPRALPRRYWFHAATNRPRRVTGIRPRTMPQSRGSIMLSRPMENLITIVPWLGRNRDLPVINCCSPQPEAAGTDRGFGHRGGNHLHRLGGLGDDQHQSRSLRGGHPVARW